MAKKAVFSGESKNVEYKVAVPGNSEKYMKTVIAYANGQGGRIIFGIDDKTLFDAICAHNPKNGTKAKTALQYAILAADPMSGFVKAVAQIYPDKKVARVKHKSVIKRFNELRFDKGANRDYMEMIEFTGLSLDDLIDVALEEMTAIADQLGL